MGGYVQMDKDLEDDPRVTALTDRLMEYCLKLGISEELVGVLRPLMRDASLGSLYRLWRHADTHLKSHNRLQASSQHVAEVTGLPVTLLRYFPSQWLVVHDDGAVELPNYSTKNALLNKDERRASGRERTARWREKQRALRDASGDMFGDASQRHTSVTTGTGPGTHPNPDPNLKIPSNFPPSGKDRPRRRRANGTNPRALGINLRANGTNPRALRNRSLEEFRVIATSIDRIKGSNLTWAALRQDADPLALSAVTALGSGDFDRGCRLLADRDKFTTGDLETRFRVAFEQLVEPEASP
jgi:hypothetical protein